MNILKALKLFFYALTGQTPSGCNISDVIRDATGSVANLSALSETVGDETSGLVKDVGDATSGLVKDVNDLMDQTVKFDDPATQTSFVLKSSTESSTKEFRIAVVDDGTIITTEVHSGGK